MKKKMDTKMLVTAAILIALQIILSRFLSINAWNLKIGFAFVAVFVAAYFYGPAFSTVVAVISDILGALLFLVDAKAASFVTGIVIPVDGGFSAYSGV